jgi:hypothetical protein
MVLILKNRRSRLHLFVVQQLLLLVGGRVGDHLDARLRGHQPRADWLKRLICFVDGWMRFPITNLECHPPMSDHFCRRWPRCPPSSAARTPASFGGTADADSIESTAGGSACSAAPTATGMPAMGWLPPNPSGQRGLPAKRTIGIYWALGMII